jgi:hypothetical protein
MIVIHTEHTSKTSAVMTRFFAPPRGRRMAAGRGDAASGGLSIGVYTALGCAVLMSCVWLMVGAGSALALSAGPPEASIIDVSATTTTLSDFDGNIRTPGKKSEDLGLETHWRFEYATSEEGAYAPVPGASGSVVTGDEYEITGPQESETHFMVKAGDLTGLTPETTYYVRLVVENINGTSYSSVSAEKTSPLRPYARASVTSVAETSAVLAGSVYPHSSETIWRLEYSLSENGVYVPVPGGAGIIFAAEATEQVYGIEATELKDLSPGTRYYVRLAAENAYGESLSRVIAGFETGGLPTDVTTDAVHAIHGEDMRALGSVVPRSENNVQQLQFKGAPTGGAYTLEFDGQKTSSIAFGAPPSGPGGVQSSLEALSTIGAGNVAVSEVVDSAHEGNPNYYYIEFVGAKAGQEQPKLITDASLLVPSGATVDTSPVNQGGGSPYPAQARFEYVSESQFAEHGWTGAALTPESTIPSGAYDETTVVPFHWEAFEGHEIEIFSSIKAFAKAVVFGVDLPDLRPGETYRYRLAVTSGAPGAQVVRGAEQKLTMPAATSASEEAAPCPNAALRVGPSAHLPDCRAYEQVTPADKEGSEDIFDYDALGGQGALIGADGEHVMVYGPGLQWGPSPDPVNSHYFFTRNPEKGWLMTSARPEGLSSPYSYQPVLYTPDLTQIGVEVFWQPTPVSESEKIGFEFGPPGGPYVSAASVLRPPRTATGTLFTGEWAAASADGSKAIFETNERALVPGHPSETISGYDLYEYSAQAGLRQLNVETSGAKISACGAALVHGQEGNETSGKDGPEEHASPNAVSADGSRVFFYDSCTDDLYMRVDGRETVNIGAYTFLAGNPDDSKLLLDAVSGERYEVFLYETESRTMSLLLSLHQRPALIPSEDLDVFYLTTSEQLTPEGPPASDSETHYLYRYDVLNKALRFVLNGGTGEPDVSPDGRFFYFLSSEVEGVPGGRRHMDQVYRYDDVEDTVECMSCASSFDPEPNRSALFFASNQDVREDTRVDGVPGFNPASANGDYVFFDTNAALVPRDVDGEYPATLETLEPGEEREKSLPVESKADFYYTASSDVYEWRKDGIDGCNQIAGCLSLITSGTGGLKNMLLGTDTSGRDVFFTTHSQLVPQDTDTSGDVYDARIDGGFPPPPPRPVECEGDSCSAPFAAPDDPAPSSATFHGAGDVPPGTVSTVVSKGKRKPKSKKKTEKKTKRSGKAKGKVKKAGDRRRARR